MSDSLTSTKKTRHPIVEFWKQFISRSKTRLTMFLLYHAAIFPRLWSGFLEKCGNCKSFWYHPGMENFADGTPAMPLMPSLADRAHILREQLVPLMQVFERVDQADDATEQDHAIAQKYLTWIHAGAIPSLQAAEELEQTSEQATNIRHHTHQMLDVLDTQIQFITREVRANGLL